MATQQKITRILAGGRLWVLPAAFSFLSLSWVAPANAVETAPPNAPSFLISQATQTKPAASRPRPKPAFFEEERRPRFGFGDFLNSALDGVDNSFSGDAVQKSSITLEPVSEVFTRGVNGTLTVGINDNRRTTSDPINNPAFLNGSFLSTDGTNLQFSNVISGSSPQRGTLNVNGTIFINGVPNPVIGVREYSASGNENNGFVSATVQLVDPNNPSQAIFIQVPASRNSGDRNTARGPANLSIGRPIDR
ncbi:hypothetical protein QUA56_27695 [Microcoleus sp. N3A4]|uniref:hypothetical protein n=1 Tax=Microcoleus sp. N3A4 TaxID=3055379 RepID=UPI002FD3136B